MILHGDLFDVLPTLAPESIDACVTDPPYGIGFMGKEWDCFKPASVEQGKIKARKNHTEQTNPNLKGRLGWMAGVPLEYDSSITGLKSFQEWTERWAREVGRVLKPGAHLLVCGAPRSFHRMTCGLEDAGFVVRDCLTWLYGQGFPKSLNIGDGRGTALKPGWEPIVLARKPFMGTVRANVERFGTGALNIDVCRLEGTARETGNREEEASGDRSYAERGSTNFALKPGPRGGDDAGRWPPNVLLDDEVALALDKQSGELVSGANPTARGSNKFNNTYGMFKGHDCVPARGLDIGGASRFFYVAKPSREERDLGCEHLPRVSAAEITGRKEGSAGLQNPRAGVRAGSMDRNPLERAARNIHPTVKPLALMRWLVKLVTPSGGKVLDPFGGSGTTAMACAAEGFEFVLIEREAEYIPIIEARVRSIAPLFGQQYTRRGKLGRQGGVISLRLIFGLALIGVIVGAVVQVREALWSNLVFHGVIELPREAVSVWSSKGVSILNPAINPQNTSAVFNLLKLVRVNESVRRESLSPVSFLARHQNRWRCDRPSTLGVIGRIGQWRSRAIDDHLCSVDKRRRSSGIFQSNHGPWQLLHGWRFNERVVSVSVGGIRVRLNEPDLKSFKTDPSAVRKLGRVMYRGINPDLPHKNEQGEKQHSESEIFGLHFRPVTFWRGTAGIACLFASLLPAYAWRNRFWWVPTSGLVAVGLALMFPPA